jgi:hypothetical protein
MKLILGNAALFLFVTITASPASAVEQCRQIKAKVDRWACHDRQLRGLAEKRQAVGADADKPRVDPVDQLKIENDRVSRRLKGICRGC